jgi:hypothetical protein
MTDSPDQRDAKNAARRERARAYKQAWYQANRDRILEGNRLRYRTDPDYHARQRKVWLRRYGLTLVDFDRMLARQHGLCLICWKPFTRTPCIDHSHATELVRCLFCDHCNIGCGHFFDNPVFLRRAADVLEFFNKREEELLRGDPAAVKEAKRLRTALLDLDISHLLPPKDQLPRVVASAAELPRRKAAVHKVVSSKTVQPVKSERKKRAQPRSGRRQRGRPQRTARAPARATSSVRALRTPPRRQAAGVRAKPRRRVGRRQS